MKQTSLTWMIIGVRRGDSGAGAAVYAGVIVVVVILVGVLALGMTPVGQSLASGIRDEICSIFGASCGDGDSAEQGGSETVDALRPGECMVSSHEDSSSSYVKIGFVKIGGSFGFITQREQYYDPETGEIRNRYNVIATDGASLGVEGGVGAKGNIGNVGVGADLSAEAGVDIKGGDTWKFDSEEDMSAFIAQYNEYRTQNQILVSPGGGGYALYLALTDGFVSPPRAPDSRSVTLDQEVALSGEAGVRARRKNGAASKGDVDPNLGVDVGASANRTWVRTDDLRPEHVAEYSLTMAYSGKISGGANVVFAGVGGEGSYEGELTFAYTTGDDGEPVLVGVTFNQVTYGDLTWSVSNGPVNKLGGANVTGTAEDADRQPHVTQTSLEVTDANRAVVEQWISDSVFINPAGGAAVVLPPPNVLNPAAPYPSDPMAQLLYEEATSTDTTYNVTGDDFSLGGEVALGVKLGGGISEANSDQSVAESTYLGSPSKPGAPRLRESNLVCQ